MFASKPMNPASLQKLALSKKTILSLEETNVLILIASRSIAANASKTSTSARASIKHAIPVTDAVEAAEVAAAAAE